MNCEQFGLVSHEVQRQIFRKTVEADQVMPTSCSYGHTRSLLVKLPEASKD